MKKSFKMGLVSLGIVLILASAFTTSKAKFSDDFWYLHGTTSFVDQNTPANELTSVQNANVGNGHTYNLSGGAGFHPYEDGFTTKDPMGTLDATIFESN